MARSGPEERAGTRPWTNLQVALLPLLIALIQVQGTRFAALDQPDATRLDALGFVLLLAGPLALLARRRYPTPVLVAVLAVTVTYFALGYPYGPVFLSVVLALVGALIRGHRLSAWVGAGVGYLALLLVHLLPGGHPPASPMAWGGSAAWVLVVLLAGEGLRVRRERAAEAARTRAEQDRRRASEERLAIARDLHDLLAHNISLINVQASVALHLLDERPQAARDALTAIKQASKDVLTEMRSVLGVLRGTDEAAPRVPAPSLTRLDELTTRSSDAGLDLRTQVRGEPVPLPASVDAAAYRVLQEALTNAARHARPARATALVSYGDGEVSVQVDNPMAASAPSAGVGTGNGIAGMRERVTAVGGEFSAGPSPDRTRFRVFARFPLDGAG